MNSDHDKLLEKTDDPVYGTRAKKYIKNLLLSKGFLNECMYIKGEGQDVHTPSKLCSEICGKLGEYCDLLNKNVLTLNIEFIQPLLDCGAFVYFLADTKRKKNLAKLRFGKHSHFRVEYGCLLEWETNMKFDVIVGNPPYQAPTNKPNKKGSGASGSRNTIWDKFVEMSFNICNPNGFVCLVHPSRWRKPEDRIGNILKQKQLLYLEIHNAQDGLNIFNAATRYDWYIATNSNCHKDTTIKDERGFIIKKNIGTSFFIPNYNTSLIESILANNGDEKCPLLYDRNEYGIDRPWMSREKTTEFIYPCVVSTGKQGIRWMYSSRKGSFFGVPKVIFGESRQIDHVIIDLEGKYAMTSGSMAIAISSKEEAVLIKQALESEKFNTEIILACRWSSFRIESKMFRYFRRDFWKNFI